MASPTIRGESAHFHQMPPVSVILPVLNEQAHLREAIGAILNQNFSGELEVILALGPSHDQTNKIAGEIRDSDARVHLLDNPSGSTAQGLNQAIAQSKNEIIVRIDGHSKINSDYIREAVLTLEKTGAVNVGGIMAAVGVTTFQKAVACAMRSLIGVGSARFHTGGSEGPTDTVYLGVFKKSALLEIGGYDEKFTRAQDWEMNYRLRQKGGIVWFNPKLVVTYRPRSGIKDLANQYFNYGRWRRAVSRAHQGTVNFRYLAPPIAVLINFLSLISGLFLNPIFFIPLVIYISAISLAALLIGKSWGERIRLPFVLATMHMAWGFGFITSPRKLIR